MLTIENNAQDLARLQSWFPTEIENDPWIVPDDVPAISYNWSDGLRIYDVLSRSRCAAKLVIRGDNHLSSDVNEHWHKDNLWRQTAEVARSAQLRGRAADPLDLTSEEMLFDPNGAEDFQFKLAAEHGPPQMRECALELAAQQTSVRKSISRRLSGD